jgi:hypothetical protein
MKSTDRIIKYIPIEIKPKDFTGDFNGIIGVMFTKLLTVQIQLVNELQEN